MPTSPLSTDEFNRLETACRNLATSSVQDEEAEAARSPMLILMSTVLSLNRRWYSHALPARRHFEQNLYTRLSPKTLRTFRDAANSGSVNRTDWLALARALWGRNERDKAPENQRPLIVQTPLEGQSRVRSEKANTHQLTTGIPGRKVAA